MVDGYSDKELNFSSLKLNYQQKKNTYTFLDVGNISPDFEQISTNFSSWEEKLEEKHFFSKKKSNIEIKKIELKFLEERIYDYLQDLGIKHFFPSEEIIEVPSKLKTSKNFFKIERSPLFNKRKNNSKDTENELWN